MPPEPASLHDTAAGLVIAISISFLIGRTRQESNHLVRKPGIRDFIILAVAGAVCALLENPVLTLVTGVGSMGVILLMRHQQGQGRGITTELAALSTFLLGFLCMSPYRPVAAGLGIALAGILSIKQQIHTFAFRTISQQEFGDTLKFLALIFIIYPLLPEGGYGPFDFFEPRKIWFFIILVSGVSFVGYFFSKFLDPEKSVLATAVVGGLASTTAYTGGISREAAASPGSAIPFARAALLANTILFPRMLIILSALNAEAARHALPVLAVMAGTSVLCAWLLGNGKPHPADAAPAQNFKNPFTLGPALKFGAIFTGVLLLAQVGNVYGHQGQLLASGVGGLIDVDAVLVSATGFFKDGTMSMHTLVLAMVIAASANALFKAILAAGSGTRAFYLRVIAGLALSHAAGFAAALLLP